MADLNLFVKVKDQSKQGLNKPEPERGQLHGQVGCKFGGVAAKAALGVAAVAAGAFALGKRLITGAEEMQKMSLRTGHQHRVELSKLVVRGAAVGYQSGRVW